MELKRWVISYRLQYAGPFTELPVVEGFEAEVEKAVLQLREDFPGVEWQLEEVK